MKVRTDAQELEYAIQQLRESVIRKGFNYFTWNIIKLYNL